MAGARKEKEEAAWRATNEKKRAAEEHEEVWEGCWNGSTLLGLKSYFLPDNPPPAPQACRRPPMGPCNTAAASPRPGGQELPKLQKTTYFAKKDRSHGWETGEIN